MDLNHRGFESSLAHGSDGRQQVGSTRDYNPHALLWYSTAASVVDLNPSGLVDSHAYGISSGQQAGRGRGPSTRGEEHALLWRASAASVVDLHSRGFRASGAEGISGPQQVGWGLVLSTDHPHALLWRGSAASVVDLHPRGFVESWAYGAFDGQQVEVGWDPATGGRDCPRALLWRDTPASVVVLHPTSGFECSVEFATSGGQQVGWGGGAGGIAEHALLWRGTAASVVDLHTFLPQAITGPTLTASIPTATSSVTPRPKDQTRRMRSCGCEQSRWLLRYYQAFGWPLPHVPNSDLPSHAEACCEATVISASAARSR
jgi:hypothetical protein